MLFVGLAWLSESTVNFSFSVLLPYASTRFAEASCALSIPSDLRRRDMTLTQFSGSGFSQYVDSGQISLMMWSSPDAFKAFVAGREVVQDLVSGKTAFDPLALEGAISSIGQYRHLVKTVHLSHLTLDANQTL